MALLTMPTAASNHWPCDLPSSFNDVNDKENNMRPAEGVCEVEDSDAAERNRETAL